MGARFETDIWAQLLSRTKLVEMYTIYFLFSYTGELWNWVGPIWIAREKKFVNILKINTVNFKLEYLWSKHLRDVDTRINLPQFYMKQEGMPALSSRI